MEQRKSEPRFDDIEELLGEIPNVTSGVSRSEESEPKTVYFNDKMMPISVNSSRGPLTQRLQNNKRFDDQKPLSYTTDRYHAEDTGLPDDNSFTSAFAELNLNSMPSLQNYKSSSNMGSQVILGAPSNVPCDFGKFDVAKAGQEVENAHKRLLGGYCQQVQNISPGCLTVHGLPGLQFVSNLQVPGAEFALMADQNQYLSNTQSSHCLNAQQLNQPCLSLSNPEDERYGRMKMDGDHYFRMNQHFLYLQQLQNRNVEAHHPGYTDVKLQSKLTNANPRQEYYENQHPQQDTTWHDNVAANGLNRHNLIFSPAGHKIVNGRLSFPEKILARSQHGLNNVKAVKYCFVGGNESNNHVKQNGRVISHGHRLQELSALGSECYQLDGLSPWDMYSDSVTLDSKNLTLQGQRFNSLEEARGKIYFMAKDQHGCRFLQRKFAEKNPKDIEMIFPEIINHIVELMMDPFGNYLVQKLLEVCNNDQRIQIIRTITRKPGDLVRISCDMHGTRAVQKVIETLKTSEQVSMVVSALKPGIVALIKNMNGNHVAQRCLQYLMPQCRKFLFEAATSHCVELATDRHGCCVLQKCLSHSEGEQRHRLLCEITSNALILSQDPFGNYVVQYVFELQIQWAITDILGQLEGNYTDLSMQKCSSNVVEKCLKYADEERRAHIIRELINDTRLDQVMQDPFGNYVIQAALHQSKGSLYAALVDAIRPHVPSLRTNPYGKKVLSTVSLKK